MALSVLWIAQPECVCIFCIIPKGWGLSPDGKLFSPSRRTGVYVCVCVCVCVYVFVNYAIPTRPSSHHIYAICTLNPPMCVCVQYLYIVCMFKKERERNRE